jgi:hypothetical protein
MGAFPPKCLQCKQDLRYDLANLRYHCPACEASEAPQASAAGAEGAAREAIGPPADILRDRAETFGRGAARLLHRVQRWLSK